MSQSCLDLDALKSRQCLDLGLCSLDDNTIVSQTSLPRHEDESCGRGLSHGVGTLHTELHGNRVEGGAEEAKEGAEGNQGGFLPLQH